jgi:hypothetical protein
MARVEKIKVSKSGVLRLDATPMRTGRIAFGCTVNTQLREIFVVGGITAHKVTSDLCELYHESSNTWTALPPLSKPKKSISLEILNQKYLYCFGGLSYQETVNDHACSLDDIEMLDFNKSDAKWELLKVKIPIPSYDLGVF